jgi:hypothetical protein
VMVCSSCVLVDIAMSVSSFMRATDVSSHDVSKARIYTRKKL